MPLPLLPLLAAGATAVGSAYNTFSQNQNNKRQEAFAREMYEKQKADNQNQWHLQNQYNSPQEQMNRLQSAGLNPNLVYGKGADATAGPISANNAPSFKPDAPQVDLASPLHMYNNYKLQDAQLSNLTSQNTVLEQEAALKAATTAATLTNNSRSQFDLDLATELRQTSADAARESLRSTQINNEVSLAANERAAILNDQNIKESITRIGKMRAETANTQEQKAQIRAQTQNLVNSNEIQQLDLKLRRMGVNPNDPIYLRALGQAADKIGKDSSLDDWTRNTSKNFKKKISDWNEGMKNESRKNNGRKSWK